MCTTLMHSHEQFHFHWLHPFNNVSFEWRDEQIHDFESFMFCNTPEHKGWDCEKTYQNMNTMV